MGAKSANRSLSDFPSPLPQVCELGPDGKRRREFRIGAGVEEIEAFAATLDAEDQVVLAATFHTWVIVRILRPDVDRVMVANPLQVKAIAHARIKTDKVDAHTLAQQLRADFIPAVEMPTMGQGSFASWSRTVVIW